MDPTLLQTISQTLVDGKFSTFAVLVIISLLFNGQTLLTFSENFRRRRLDLLKEAAGTATFPEDLKQHFEDEIEGEYFNLIHKVNMDKGLRTACLQAYASSDGDIVFNDFVRARNHLKLVKGALSIDVSYFSNAAYYYNLLAGTGLLLFSSHLFVALDNLDKPVLVDLALHIGLSVISLIYGLFMLKQTLSVRAARRLKDQLLPQRC